MPLPLPVTDNYPSWISRRGRMTVEMILCCRVITTVMWSSWDSNLRSLDLQTDMLPTVLCSPAPTASWSCSNLSQHTTKPTIRLVQPLKTQIGLPICAVWPESSLIVCGFYSLSFPKRKKQVPLPYWLDVQTDLSLCWSDRSYCRFCRVLAHFISSMARS